MVLVGDAAYQVDPAEKTTAMITIRARTTESVRRDCIGGDKRQNKARDRRYLSLSGLKGLRRKKRGGMGSG